MNDLIVRPTTTSALAEIDPASLKTTARMVKAMVTGAYGREMNEQQALQLAFISLTTGLNPLTGELYMTDTGPQIGVLAYERKASEYLDAYHPGTDYHIQYRSAVPGIDADFDPDKGDLGYVAVLTRDDWDNKWRTAYGDFFRMYIQAGMEAGVADSLTRQHIGSKPSTEYAGVVDGRESFSGEYKAGGNLPEGAKAGDKKPEMMDRHERAKKRARKGVLKHEFPRMDIPDPLAVLAGGQKLIGQALAMPDERPPSGRTQGELMSEIMGDGRYVREEQEQRIDVTPVEPVTRELVQNGNGNGSGYAWLVADGLVDHPKHADALAKLLHLDELDEMEQRDRVQIYRSWRELTEDKKVAAAHAIQGNLPEVDPEPEAA